MTATVLAVTALAGVACGEDGDPAESGRGDDIGRFCAAVEALDATDGTTEDRIVIDALEAMRQSAPAEIRDDVGLLADFAMLTDYPAAADDSMSAPSPEERIPAARRVSGYVEEHCGITSGSGAAGS